ncbi:aminotransferase-like domain-containing protein [Vagococcus hydrophili]|uniref:PLP-dependent aminotransferase family protein n=1 Tax=Vagococcus hydrophili TaxID=2714947 RepID=A0A6G8AXR6_9ENTE|nr:PLP-dependent aminotransferase family protein [Vagococcus hydrophili]QIL49673.1 PLP-dependent aminotransferase family protein [Vagococcus hydrophili]
MKITIDKNNKIPLYRQVMNQIISQIEQGSLVRDERLLSERALAKEIGVNRSTIVRAYEELHAQGFVVRKSNSGTYILGDYKGSLSKENLPVVTSSGLKEIEDKNSYINKVEAKQQQNAQGFINAFTGELPLELIPKVSLDNVSFEEFLQEEISHLGYEPLREEVALLFEKMYGFKSSQGNIMLTGGGQQSLFLLIQSLLKPGDTIAVENPSFFYDMSLFRSMSINVVQIQVDDKGMVVSELKKLLEVKNVHLVLTNPNFQNPTGSTLSLERRHELIKLCQKYRIPIIEDDVFGQLSYQVPNPMPLLKELAPKSVIYIGSLSKILGKRIQLGWIDAPEVILNEVVRLRDEYESELSIFPQVLATYVLKDIVFDEQLSKIRHNLEGKMRLLQSEIKLKLDKQVELKLPKGGYYAWLTFTKTCTRKDWHDLLSKGIAVYPSFLDTESCQSCRLNIARVTESEIKKVVSELKQMTEK